MSTKESIKDIIAKAEKWQEANDSNRAILCIAVEKDPTTEDPNRVMTSAITGGNTPLLLSAIEAVMDAQPETNQIGGMLRIVAIKNMIGSSQCLGAIRIGKDENGNPSIDFIKGDGLKKEADTEDNEQPTTTEDNG